MDVTTELLQRISQADGWCGTGGKYQSLNEAVNIGGWSKILVCVGAYLEAGLTISADKGWLVGLGNWTNITGNYTLTISGDDFYLAGIRHTNTGGVGLYVTGVRIVIERCQFMSCGSSGIQLNASAGDHMISNTTCYGNGGDGIRAEANNNAAISNCRCQGNTGYGIRDNVNACLVSTCWLENNTAGSISGSKTYVDTSVKES